MMHINSMDSAQKIGLLGGTFDPPHTGHLWLAETAREQLELDKVFFLPAGHPPHKRNDTITAVSHRTEMINLAIANNKFFSMETTDIDRPPPHTTYSLLPLLRQNYPNARFWLLLGSDSLSELPTWKRPLHLITQCRLATLPRPGVKVDLPDIEKSVPGIKNVTDLLGGPTLDISSSEIRYRIKNGRSVRYLLPGVVYEYIIDNKLY